MPSGLPGPGGIGFAPRRPVARRRVPPGVPRHAPDGEAAEGRRVGGHARGDREDADEPHAPRARAAIEGEPLRAAADDDRGAEAVRRDRGTERADGHDHRVAPVVSQCSQQPDTGRAGGRCSAPAWPRSGAARRPTRRARAETAARSKIFARFLIQSLSLQSTIATSSVSAVPGAATSAWSTARATRARAPRRLGATETVLSPSARVSGCAKKASSASVACTSVRPPTSTPDTVTPSGTVGSCAPTGDAAASMTTRAPRIPTARPTARDVRRSSGLQSFGGDRLAPRRHRRARSGRSPAPAAARSCSDWPRTRPATPCRTRTWPRGASRR